MPLKQRYTMKIKADKIKKLVEQIDALIDDAVRLESKLKKRLKRIHPTYSRSARNLIQYRALRSHDVRDLQRRLGNLGLSRLARAEGHVMASLLAQRAILKALISDKPASFPGTPISIKKGDKLLARHTKDLLGYRSKGRRVRIMVTLPSEAATNYGLVHGLVQAGMNSARINCAHDGPDVWLQMIENVKRARKAERRNVKICMDLAGPKIRTGPITPGPRVVSFGPERDALGRVMNQASVWLAPPGVLPPDGARHHLPVDDTWASSLEAGDVIHFHDTRGKNRRLNVFAREEAGAWAYSEDRAYVTTGTTILHDRIGRGIVQDIPPLEQRIHLTAGDQLRLHATDEPGNPGQRDNLGAQTVRASVSCTNPDVFSQVEVGERVLFDDGKIEAIVMDVQPGESMDVQIVAPLERMAWLKSDKGINFPDSDLQIRGLTEKDRTDLEFVAKHADVVNMSFVNSAEDVSDLIAELRRLNAIDRLGIILKIETQQAFDNLTDIILEGMQVYPIGVMIARGDLAVEVGWENMARIQEEILSMCLAAHVPDIWATQVLERLAKKGLPSRAEITDAAMAQRAECVMLNKGPYIVNAIQMLDVILREMKDYQLKKAPMLPALPTLKKKKKKEKAKEEATAVESEKTVAEEVEQVAGESRSLGVAESRGLGVAESRSRGVAESRSHGVA